MNSIVISGGPPEVVKTLRSSLAKLLGGHQPGELQFFTSEGAPFYLNDAQIRIAPDLLDGALSIGGVDHKGQHCNVEFNLPRNRGTASFHDI